MLTVASYNFILTFSFFRGIAKRLPVCFMNEANLLQISIEVVQCPLTAVLFWPRIKWCWQPSGEHVLFAKVANTLWVIGQRVANNF